MRVTADCWYCCTVLFCFSSNKEQLPLVLRYVDEANKIQGLNVSSLRVQAFDGAGNMAGKCRGAVPAFNQSVKRCTVLHTH